MEKIYLDLLNESDLIEDFNEEEVSSALIDYLIEQVLLFRKKQKVTIVINNKCGTKKDCRRMIRKGLRREYKKSMRAHHFNDLEQIIFLISGLLLLIIASITSHSFILKELFIILSGVPLWKMVELEIFDDNEGRRKRKLLRRLFNSRIVVKNY